MADPTDLPEDDLDGDQEVDEQEGELDGGSEDADEPESSGEGDGEAEPQEGEEGRGRQEAVLTNDDRPSGSRAGNRFQRLSNENRELRERLDRIERDGQQRFQGPSQADIERQQREQAQRDNEELERAALEGPGAIARVTRAQAQRDFNQQIQQLRFEQHDRDDRSNFREFVRDNPHYAKLQQQVEDRVAEFRRNGLNPQRMAIARVMWAEQAEKKAAQARTKQTRRGAERIERERVQPRSGRGDVTAGRSRRGDPDSVEEFERRNTNARI